MEKTMRVKTVFDNELETDWQYNVNNDKQYEENRQNTLDKLSEFRQMCDERLGRIYMTTLIKPEIGSGVYHMAFRYSSLISNCETGLLLIE